MPGPKLAIRPLRRSDVPHLVDYWTKAKRPDLERMAVDPAKVPSAETLRGQLEALVDAPQDSTKSFYLVWLVEGRPVGYSSLKNIAHGDRAEMHLHMWDPDVRGQGYGATLFCQSALEFYERFGLAQIICEPSRGNPMPNAMLRRIGFALVGMRVGASSDLSAVTDLNTYRIDLETAQRYLRTMDVTTKA